MFSLSSSRYASLRSFHSSRRSIMDGSKPRSHSLSLSLSGIGTISGTGNGIGNGIENSIDNGVGMSTAIASEINIVGSVTNRSLNEEEEEKEDREYLNKHQSVTYSVGEEAADDLFSLTRDNSNKLNESIIDSSRNNFSEGALPDSFDPLSFSSPRCSSLSAFTHVNSSSAGTFSANSSAIRPSDLILPFPSLSLSKPRSFSASLFDSVKKERGTAAHHSAFTETDLLSLQDAMGDGPNPPSLVFSDPIEKPPISSSLLASYNKATQHLQPLHSSSIPIAPSSLSLSLSASLPHPLSSSSPNTLASSLDSVHSVHSIHSVHTDASSFNPSLAGIAGLIGLSGVARQTQGALTVSSDTVPIADSLSDNVLTGAVTEKCDEENKELTKEGARERKRKRSIVNFR
ncbi:uncharacterized protein MONOS_1922 [Monocercomonoides exilis]|uniref:uncharacterized protein n=1 Tax=Monocercomonoides exilis TaxID=2049356 RepID=UPI00355A8837|nr:hypothetical protein MONOS_1922 [Monocercomonoides exilis]|eukprot:MONOS_1922.1-p1 / transcript=MONOS_1922.1 / gene=MONOS_1922 / organism=Monocercomonoides_exilis_PA203 / gene_product=unspecified product / transcript_product=unspecified product / location=Mono_scaffold00036:184624-185924(+) / protein_length=402 / sequence_SO=supercontig / SO=protein_coding / is_pseudo=false